MPLDNIWECYKNICSEINLQPPTWTSILAIDEQWLKMVDEVRISRAEHVISDL